MRQTKRILIIIFWSIWLLAGGIILFFEINLIPSGLLAGNDIFEYFLSVGLELTTLIIIPLALWLFKWKHVANDIEKRKEKALLSWGSIRFAMLAVPMLACLIFYYLFMSPAFCYLAIVLGLCLFMVYPSSYQCAKDVSSSQEKVKS